MTTPPQQPGDGDAEDKQSEQPDTAGSRKPDGESVTPSEETGQDSQQDGQEPAESEHASSSSDGTEEPSEGAERGADESVSTAADADSERAAEPAEGSESEQGAAEQESTEQDTVVAGSSAESNRDLDASDGTPEGTEQAVGAPANGAGQSESAQSEQEQPEEGKKSKRKVALIAGIAAAVVVVLGGAGLGYAYYQSNTAEAAAEDYVELTSQEVQDPRSVTADDYRTVVCEQAMPQIEQVQQQKEQFLEIAKPEQLEQIKQASTELKGVQQDGDTATATIESGMPGQPPQTSELNVIKEDGSWKLCV